MSNNSGKGRSKEEKEAFVAKMRQTREQCFAILFEMTFTDDSYEDILDAAVESRLIETDKYTVSVLDYFESHKDEIDEIIRKNLRGWSFNRISRVSLSVLRLALCEMECRKTPPSVAINEAVELAKKYAVPKEASFVNAVLGAAVREKNGSGEDGC